MSCESSQKARFDFSAPNKSARRLQHRAQYSAARPTGHAAWYLRLSLVPKEPVVTEL
jgi:hypothetical protein